MKKTILLSAIWLIFSISIVFSQNSWKGTWSQNKNYIVAISNVTDKKFDFVFDCYKGRNMGQAEGTAKINGSEAISIQENDSGTCKIKFVLKEDYIEVFDIKEDDCYIDAGNGVYYQGKSKIRKSKKGKN